MPRCFLLHSVGLHVGFLNNPENWRKFQEQREVMVREIDIMLLGDKTIADYIQESMNP